MTLNERVIIAIERRALAYTELKRCHDAEVVAAAENKQCIERRVATDAALEQFRSAKDEYVDVLTEVEDRALTADAAWQKTRLWKERVEA